MYAGRTEKMIVRASFDAFAVMVPKYEYGNWRPKREYAGQACIDSEASGDMMVKSKIKLEKQQVLQRRVPADYLPRV